MRSLVRRSVQTAVLTGGFVLLGMGAATRAAATGAGGTLPYTGVELGLLLATALLSSVVGSSTAVATRRRRTG